MSVNDSSLPEHRAVKTAAVAALLALFVVIGISVAQLTISSGRITAGSSAFITYNAALPPYTRCWGTTNDIALVLSAPRQAGVNPASVPYYFAQSTSD